MSLAGLKVLACVAAPLLALRLAGEVDSQARVRAYEQAQAEDETFMGKQWLLLEEDLMKLQNVVSPEHNQTKMAAHNVTSNSTKTAHKTKDAQASIASAAMSMVKGSVDKAQLSMMLGLLKNLYDEQKGRISTINKQEEKGKKRWAEQEKSYKEKLERIELNHKNGKLNDEFYHNETVDANREYVYCKHCRERNHAQFHNSLKLTHATMQKEKTMIKAYEETLAQPTPSKENGGKALAKVAKDVGMPEIVFLQQAQVITDFCQASIANIRDALRDLHVHVRRTN